MGLGGGVHMGIIMATRLNLIQIQCRHEVLLSGNMRFTDSSQGMTSWAASIAGSVYLDLTLNGNLAM